MRIEGIITRKKEKHRVNKPGRHHDLCQTFAFFTEEKDKEACVHFKEFRADFFLNVAVVVSLCLDKGTA